MSLTVLSSGLSAAEPSPPASGKAPIPAYMIPEDLPAWLKELEQKGRFAEAEERLERSGSVPGLRQERERLRRIRRDYSLTESQLRERLRMTLPDASDSDFRRWISEGAFQHLVLDGETRYFTRATSNLVIFHPEARAMKERAEERDKATSSTAAGDPAGRSTTRFSTEDYIRRALAVGRASGTTEVLPVRFRVSHKVTLQADAVPNGAVVRCWVPLAVEYGRQTGATDIVTTPVRSYEAPATALQRTLYNEITAQAGQPSVFETTWSYRSAAFIHQVDPAKVQPADPADLTLREHLEERAPHVVFTPEIRRLSAEIVGTETNPWRKGERIFSWIQKNIRWAAEMEYSTIANIVEKVLTERRGDCGTQALLFVTLARAAGLPARWQSGWVTRPGGWNMHDWAELYVAPYGWLPVDPSLGGRFRDSTDEDLRLFFYGNADGYRMIANTDHSRPFDPPKTDGRSDPVDNQRGELEWNGSNLYYDTWKYDIDVTSEEIP